MVKRFFGFLYLLSFLLFTISCQPESNLPTNNKDVPTRYESEQKGQISELVDKGFLTIKGIEALPNSLETALPFGEMVSIHIKNETKETQKFRIDCGTVLRSRVARYQDLVLTRPLQIEIVAYGEWRGNLEIFSLQMRQHYPYKPATYQLGNLAKGDLRKLVECFCARHPQLEAQTNPQTNSQGSSQINSQENSQVNPQTNPQTNLQLDLTPVQYAIWRVADNVTLKQLLTYSKGRGNPSLTELEVLEKQAKEQGSFADQILSDCQITAKFLDSNP